MIAVRTVEEAAAYCHHHGWSRVGVRPGATSSLEWDCVRGAEVVTLSFALVAGEGPAAALDAHALVGVGTSLLANVPAAALGFVQGEVRRALDELKLAVWALSAAQELDAGSEIEAARAVAEARRKAWQAAESVAPLSRAFLEIPTPVHGFRPPAPLAEWLSRPVPFGVEAVPADLLVVARGPDGRFLVRHEAHTLAWLRVEADAIVDIQILQERAALSALLTWGFALLDGQKAPLRQAAAAGQQVDAFLREGLPEGRSRPILQLEAAGERVAFCEIEVREPRFRGALLVVRLDLEDNVIGFRVVEGVDGYEMMGLLDAAAPHLPGPAGERPIAAAAREVGDAMKATGAAVQPLLEALVDPARVQDVMEALRPRAGDAARVFVGDPARIAAIEAAYQSLWVKDPPRVRANAPAVTLQIHVAPAGMLAGDSAAQQPWPVPYVRVAGELNPSRTWVAWSYVPTGGGRGTDYDGLVWLDDRWVWFPAPWRVLPRVGAT